MAACPRCKQEYTVAKALVAAAAISAGWTAGDMRGHPLSLRAVMNAIAGFGILYVIWQGAEHDAHESRPRTRYRLKVFGRLVGVGVAFGVFVLLAELLSH